MQKPLGELLIEQRLITQNMLDQALALQKQRQIPLGKILLQLGYVTEEDLNTILSKQFGSIYINPRGFSLKDNQVLDLIPEETARKYKCFPIELIDQHLTIAMSDPWDTQAIQDLTESTKLTIQPIFSRKEWILQIIDKYYPTVTKAPNKPSTPERSVTPDPIAAPLLDTAVVPPSPSTTAIPTPAPSDNPKPEQVETRSASIKETPTPSLPIKTAPSKAKIGQLLTSDLSPANEINIPEINQTPSKGNLPTAQPIIPIAPTVPSVEPQTISTTLLTKPIPELTFENFVVGTSNQLAWAASKNVAEAPGTTYNPLFIYGGVGLGKTHLANAIGNLVLQKNSEMRLTYIPCNRFIEEMINAIAGGTVNTFRDQYWHLQVLIIDDVQFLAGQERTQVELFQTFEELHHRRAQIILTSDRLPKDIPQLEDRLRSRFEGGLIVDVQMPDLETRVAILHRKALQRNLELPDDIANVIATFISTNVRELEGVLNKISAISQLGGRPVTLQVVENILRELIKQGR
jgi:chromosomal replication initiator protein DnaA